MWITIASLVLFGCGRSVGPDSQDGRGSPDQDKAVMARDGIGTDENSLTPGNAYYQKGRRFYGSGNMDSALWYFSRAYEFFEADTQMLRLADTERMIAMSYWNRGLYIDALKHIDGALWRYQKLGNTKSLLAAYNTKGTIMWGLSDYKAALDLFIKTLYLYESDSINSNGHILRYINNIGMVYFDWGDDETAYNYFKQAEENIKTSSDSVGIAYTWLNLGIYYEKKGRSWEALDMLKRAKKLYNDISYDNGVSLCDIRIGQLYSGRGEYLKAENSFLEAIRSSEQYGNRHRNAFAHYHLAENDLLQGHYSQALKNSLISLDFSESEQYKELSSLLYDQLSIIYESLGEIQKALEMKKKKIVTQAAINKAKIEVQHNILDLAYRNQLKENENDRLRKENLLKQKTIYLQYIVVFLVLGLLILILSFYLRMGRRKKELQAAVHAKDKIFSIVAHDLRSPVGALNNMVEILSDEQNEVNYRQLLKEYKPVISASYSMLDDLLIWAKTNLGKIDVFPRSVLLNDLIEAIRIVYLFQTEQKNITVLSEVKPETVVFADQAILETILRNLLNNAIKFTDFDGIIRISSRREQDYEIISIADTGVGIPSDAQSSIFEGTFHAYGTRNEKGAGLGLMLCKELAVLNGGDLWFTSIEGTGSTFSFSVPRGRTDRSLS